MKCAVLKWELSVLEACSLFRLTVTYLRKIDVWKGWA
jgi:hypothetical protein